MTPEPKNEVVELPKFEGNWQKLRKLVPMFAPNWKETLDTLTTFWRDSAPLEQEKLKRFSAALMLDDIPKLEIEDARVYFDNTRSCLADFVNGTNDVANDMKPKWGEIKSMATNAENLIDGSGQDDQAIALLEAINETADLGLTPEQIRQRIAQATFEEIFLVGTHRILEYTAVEDGDSLINRSTQDSLESEKSELISTLRSTPWTTKEQKTAAKTYRAWRKVILDDGNSIDPDEVYEQFEELWNAAKGEGVTRKSSLHFLQLGEDIYQEIDAGEAFDIDLTDYDDDEILEEDE